MLGARVVPLALVPVLALCIAATLSVPARASGQAADLSFSGVLPIGAGQTVIVTQGNNQGDHVGNQRYAFDFASGQHNFLITAAQAGTVIGLNDSSDIQCSSLDWESSPVSQLLPGCWTHANFILIKDDDGTTATLYMHLLQRSACTVRFCVQTGDHVTQGEPLARAGTTGWSSGIHLHFQAETIPTPGPDPYSGWWFTTSVPAHFTNPEVTAQDSDGIPIAGQTFHLGAVSKSTGAQPSPVDWMNTRYTTNCGGIAKRPVTVTVHDGRGKGGTYTPGLPPSQTYYSLQVIAVASGQLQGPGPGQTAVLLLCAPEPSNYFTTEIQVFAAGRLLGTPIDPPNLVPNGLYPLPFFDGKPFSISGGVLHAGGAYYGPNDCHACGPSIQFLLGWRWNGAKFVLATSSRIGGRPPQYPGQ